MTTRKSRPAGNGAAIKQTGQVDAIVTAPALILPPAGRRRLPVAVVACPYCSGRHLHRGGRLDGATRTAGCGGHRYALAVPR